MRLVKLLSIASLVFGATVSLSSIAAAHDIETAAPQTYTVFAGASGPSNTDVLAFAPQSLQVHRGDTVVWQILGFHNVRFDNQPGEFIIAPVIDGQPVPQFNPELAFANIESGATYTGGVVNSGLPNGSAFSLVMDVEPGTYAYLCDVHPGMVGTITVVEDSVEIPSPEEALTNGVNEISANVGAGLGAAGAAMAMAGHDMDMGEGSTDHSAHVMAGARGGASSVQMFFPAVVTIHAGESVTWQTAQGTPAEPHTVTAFPLPTEDEQVVVVPPSAEGQPPMLTLGAPWTPNVQDGQEITPDQYFNSGIILPDQTISLTFNEPGVYSYGCFLHPGMIGAVVVLPAE
jgi:plastocyanin